MNDEEVEVLLKELDIISESYEDIEIKESSIKNLHNIMLKYSKKDEWHKGDYKQHSNAIEANHPLVKSAIFAYEFVSIHPFQDGNGRLSRLLTTLLLLKNGCKWIEYVSFEHEIENRKSEYYRVLRSCQAQRPNENVSDWVIFFFDALKNIQDQLLKKLELSGVETQLSP